MLPALKQSARQSGVTPNLSGQNQSRLSKLVTPVLILAIGLVLGIALGQNGTIFGWKIPFLIETTATYRLTKTDQPARYSDVKFDLFWKVWSILEQKYLEPQDIDLAKMVDGAIAGMVASLGDPYTSYIPPQPNQITEQDLAGQFYGIGVELGYIEGVPGIITPLNDSPAERAGVTAGDIIMHISDERKGIDEDTYDWMLDEVQTALRGEQATSVVVTLFRPGYNDSQPFDVTLQREEIKVDSFVNEFIKREDKVYAHIILSRFSERTSEELEQAVTEILARRSEVAGIILDMRNNPGGLVTAAIEVASEFIADGVIVTDQGRVTKHNYYASGKARLEGLPVVVLVNGGSASASEIVAGAMRDRLGTKLIGTTTFGKGLVQERLELENGAGLNITIAKWVMPGGDWLSHDGLVPDIEVEQDRETEIDEVLEVGIKELQTPSS